MQEVSLKALLEAGCHFGHKTNRWHPKAAVYIYKAVGDTHIIDLVKTKEGLGKAAAFITTIIADGGEVLFVGTKRQARSIIKEEASAAGAPYFYERWIGGFLTNWAEVQKNVTKLANLKKQVLDKEEMAKYTKRERLMMEQEIRDLSVLYGGVAALERMPQAVFIIDVRKEKTALAEAMRMSIPVVGIVDTNTDPSDVDYPIPANDDAIGSVKLITAYLAEAYAEGKKSHIAKIKEQTEQKEQKEKKEKEEQEEKKQKTVAIEVKK